MRSLYRVFMKALCVAGLFTLAFAPGAFGQQKTVTLEELTKTSEVIAVGQVKNLTSEWDESGSRIRTKVLLSVDEYIEGSGSGNTLTLYVPGGEVDGVGELYTHMPVFKKNEQVMVFAAKDKLHHYRVSAGEQGKFTLKKDEAGKVVVPGHATLEEFSTEVKNAVKRLQTGDIPQH
jgi:hypothetical protein